MLIKNWLINGRVGTMNLLVFLWWKKFWCNFPIFPEQKKSEKNRTIFSRISAKIFEWSFFVLELHRIENPLENSQSFLSTFSSENHLREGKSSEYPTENIAKVPARTRAPEGYPKRIRKEREFTWACHWSMIIAPSRSHALEQWCELK